MKEQVLSEKKRYLRVVFLTKQTFFMTNETELTPQERMALADLHRQLSKLAASGLRDDDYNKVKGYLTRGAQTRAMRRDLFGLHPLINDLKTAVIVATEIGMSRGAVLGVLLNGLVIAGEATLDEISRDFGDDVAVIVRGLVRIHELYEKNPVVESENFRQLLLSFAEDMRVILIVIASRVCIMRQIKEAENDEARRRVSMEAAYLYAPLAHKLGLYKLKSELEDLSLKYLEHDAYYHIKDKLNATK